MSRSRRPPPRPSARGDAGPFKPVAMPAIKAAVSIQEHSARAENPPSLEAGDKGEPRRAPETKSLLSKQPR
jgi:hypothetical protein